MPAVYAVLDALLGMARRSPRGQAYVDAALRSAKMKLSAAQRDSMVQALLHLGEIENVVPLEDGGMLVTSRGLPRPNWSLRTEAAATGQPSRSKPAVYGLISREQRPRSGRLRPDNAQKAPRWWSRGGVELARVTGRYRWSWGLGGPGSLAG